MNDKAKLQKEYRPFYISVSILFFIMKNWKSMAESAGLDIPDVERIIPALDALEAAFRPLVKTIPHDVEPALMFRATAEEMPEEQS